MPTCELWVIVKVSPVVPQGVISCRNEPAVRSSSRRWLHVVIRCTAYGWESLGNGCRPGRVSCCLSLLSGVDRMNFHIRSEAHAILRGILKYLRVLGMRLFITYIQAMSVSSDT